MRLLYLILIFFGTIIPALSEEPATLSDSLINFLGKDKNDETLLKFTTENGLKDCNKGDEGAFMGDLKKSSFSLLYRKNKITRISLRISVPTTVLNYSEYAVFTDKLPFELVKSDTPDDVIKKLGKPTHRPEPTYLSYDKNHLTVLFYRNSENMSEVNIDEK